MRKIEILGNTFFVNRTLLHIYIHWSTVLIATCTIICTNVNTTRCL